MEKYKPTDATPDNGGSNDNGDKSAPSPGELKKLIDELPDPQKKAVNAILKVFSVQVQQFSGPLPHPSILAGYDKIVPNGAERIMQGFEAQQRHRIDMESRTIRSNNTQGRLGQIFGLIIALAFLYVAYDLTIKGHPIAGTILGSVDLVGLVAIFVLGKRSVREDLRNKL